MMLKSYSMEILRAGQKATGLEGSMIGPTAPRGKLDLPQWGSPRSKLWGQDKQVQDCQKVTQ